MLARRRFPAKPRRSARRLATLTATVVCSAVCAAAWSQDALIPPKIADVVREKATGQEVPMRIVALTEAQISVRRPQPQMLSREQYEIAAWEGVTNAPEILAGCESILRRMQQGLEAIELHGDQNGAVARLESQHNLVAEALNRIRSEAGQAHQRAKTCLLELNGMSAEDALQRHAILRRVWPAMAVLELALRREEFDKLPEICRQIHRELALVVSSSKIQREQEQARAVIVRLNAVLASLQAAASELAPLPGDAPPADVTLVARHLALVNAQALALQPVTGTPWLGPDVHDWFLRRQATLAQQRSRLEALSRLTGGLIGAAGELTELEASLAASSAIDLSDVKQRFAAIERKLAADESRLKGEPDHPDVRYAMEQLVRLRNTLPVTRRTTILRLLENGVEDCLKAATSATDPQGLRQRSDRMAARIQQLQSLPKAEYPPVDQLRIDRLIDQLRSARMECAVQVAEADLTVLRGEFEEMLASATAANLPPHQSKLHVWNAGLDAVRKELQSAMEGEDAVLPPQRYETALERLDAIRGDLGSVSELIAIQQDLAALPQAVASLQEYRMQEAALVSLAKRTEALPAAGSPPLVRSLQQTIRAIDRAQSALEEVKPRIEFEQAEHELQQQLAGLQTALNAHAVLQARRGHQAVVSSLDRLESLLQQTPALANTPQFPQQVQEASARSRELALRVDALLARRRREAGWQPLPMPGQPLVAPTPHDATLRIALLLGTGRRKEAEAAIRSLQAAYPDPPWSTQAANLQARLEYQSAVAWEEAGESERARQAYAALAGNSRNGVLAAAAHSALRRMTSRRQRESRDRQARLCAMALGGTLASGFAGALVLAWRSSPRQRLHRARKRLAAAQEAAARGDIPQRDRYLRAVAETLAKFPDDDLEASRLRARIGRPDASHNTSAVPRALPAPRLAGPEVLEQVLGSSDTQGVPVCLAWLRQHAISDRDQQRRQQVLQWLAARLQPSPDLLPEQLQERAGYLAEIGDLLQDQTWPCLYAVGARWWLGDDSVARSLAEPLADAVETLSGPGQLCLALALCWWKAGKVAPAVRLLQRLLQDSQDPDVRAQAKRWLDIFRAARPAAKGKSPTPSSARLAASLLRD